MYNSVLHIDTIDKYESQIRGVSNLKLVCTTIIYYNNYYY